MDKIIVLIVLMFTCLFAKAQQANSTKNANSLTVKFSGQTLKAYQESAKNKIGDFYQYLQLLSDPAIAAPLKNEIMESVYLLFKNKDIQVINLFSNEKKQLGLSTFIGQVKANPSLTFSLGEITCNEIQTDSWQMNYTLEITNGAIKSQYPVIQKVYLTTGAKIFGTNVKEVWQLTLGEIQ